MGNRRANMYWEARLSSGFRRPSEGDMVGLKNFIEEKYRNRAYVARGYSQPPSIENFATHPFFEEMKAKETGSSSAPEEASQSAAAQPSAGAKPAAPAAKALHSAAAVSAAASAPAPPAQLFDLLSLHDAPAASTAAAAPAATAAAGQDEGWAAFLDASPAPVSTVQPVTEPASSLDDHWDAFQGSTTPEASSSASVSAAEDPFAPKAQPSGRAAAQQEPPASLDDPFADAPSVQRPGREAATASPVPKKSAADILKMFDAPVHGQPQMGMAGGLPQMGGAMGGMPEMMPQQYGGMQGMGGGFQQQQFYMQQMAGGVQGLQPVPFMGAPVGPQPAFMNGGVMPYPGPYHQMHQPMPTLPPNQAPQFANAPKMNGSFL
ncbi:probable ADP-ribosylation factor GTPase-activating protein AGD5 at N-terminal half [Coccomyxa sp. Obi]|nr:probable ADP-ribosylation factor GTPase-activating protein AGD5 at N-terminal half [Coccomyxa sp. Obi]